MQNVYYRSGSNHRKHQDASARTIKILEKRLDTIEFKEELTMGDIHSINRMSEFSYVSNDEIYHFTIVDQPEDNKEAETKQEVLDEHEVKVLELIDAE